MKELQRIVFQKKYLLSVIILLLTNLCLFQYFQMDTLESIKDTTTRNVIEKEWKENQNRRQHHGNDLCRRLVNARDQRAGEPWRRVETVSHRPQDRLHRVKAAL